LGISGSYCSRELADRIRWGLLAQPAGRLLASGLGSFFGSFEWLLYYELGGGLASSTDLLRQHRAKE